MPGVERSQGMARFEDFELDLRSAELRRNGNEAVRLADQPFRILIVLLEHPREIVSREEIRRRLWPNDTIVEFEHSINAAMNRLRQALGDSGDNPRYIETLARRGYRWTVPVEWVESSPAVAPPFVSSAAHPRARESLIGKKVSHYRILEVLGGGGMGVVYKAEDLRLGRCVAIKFLGEEFLEDHRALERFEREARAISGLDHPNICTIYEVEEHDEQSFIVMQLLQGQTLRQRIESSGPEQLPFPLDELVNIAIAVAMGLNAAHQKGIIHRDIKPANIFITLRGEVKLLDFGLAKLVGAEGAPNESLTPRENEMGSPSSTTAAEVSEASLTLTGTMMGTASYMSPEQVLRQPVDARTDLFSFGTVLYEMATGRQPFHGDSMEAIHDAILNSTPLSPLHRNPDLPMELEHIINKAFEKSPPLRYQNAADMCTDLQRVKRETTSSISEAAVYPVARTQRVHPAAASVVQEAVQHKLGPAAGLLVVLVVLSAAGYGVYSMFTGGQAAKLFQNYTVSQITDNAKSQAAAISPDGKYILSEVVDAGMASLWLRHVPTNSTTQIIAPSEAFYTNFDFSPDGNYFYFRKARDSTLDEFDLYRAPVLGGNPRIVVLDIDSTSGFSPDGKHIAYERGNDPEVGKFQVLIANADGTDEKIIGGGSMGSLHRYIAWSPDGTRVALTDVVGDAPGPIQLMDLASGKTQNFVAIKGFVFLKSVWLPDGHGLLVQYQDMNAGPNHNQIGFVSYPGGQFHTITNDTNSYESLSLSADAKTLATVQLKRLYTLYAIPAAGRGPNSPTMPQQQKGSLSFTWAGNDGFYLAEDNQLVRVSSDGSNKTTLLNNTSITSVSSCPDGRTLLLTLVGQGGSGTNIWRVNADGTNLKQLSNGQRDRSPECSFDSKRAYYINANISRIESVPLNGGTPETVPGTPIPHALILDRYFDLLPDGKSVAFLISIGEKTPVHKIAVVPLDAGPQPPVRLIDPHPGIWYPLRFTPDGKALVYPITQNRVENLWRQPLDGSPSRQLTNFRTDQILGLRWSPDGKDIGVLSRRIDADVVLLRESSTTTQ